MLEGELHGEARFGLQIRNGSYKRMARASIPRLAGNVVNVSKIHLHFRRRRTSRKAEAAFLDGAQANFTHGAKRAVRWQRAQWRNHDIGRRPHQPVPQGYFPAVGAKTLA